MSTWIFEPGHTEAEFRVQPMMVPWVRGLFRHLHGQRETMNRAPAHGNTPETLPDIGP